MSKLPNDPLSAFTGPGQEAFKLWISLWPVAPLFGVEWRYAEQMSKFTGFDGVDAMQKMFQGMSGPMTPPGRTRAEKPRHAKPAPAAKPAPVRAAEPAAAPKPAPMVEVVANAEAPATKPKAAEPVARAQAPEAMSKAEAPAAKPAPAKAAPQPAEPAAAGGAAGDGTRPKGLLSAAPSSPDDLKLIKGIGPGLESKLNALGVFTFEQIAGFDEANLVWIDENLTAFKGRCFRDDWVGQARGLLG